MVTPGRYLQLRRNAAGLSVLATASAIVGLPVAIRRASVREINRMAERLHAVEADIAPLSWAQAGLVGQAIAFDHYAYDTIRRAWESGLQSTLRVCECCGCSDMMACVDDDGPCAWAELQPPLCTSCARAAVTSLLVRAPFLPSHASATL